MHGPALPGRSGLSLFSVVIPSCDRPDLLERLLESVRRQTFRDFDVTIVDDASADKEAYRIVIARFSREIPLRYLRNEENRGAQFSRNRGLARATGEFVAFVDDDDEWLPVKLERQAALFLRAPAQVGLVYAWADEMGQDGSVTHRYRAVHRGDVLPRLIDDCFVPSPTVVVRREAFARTGDFDEGLPSCQDWDMWTRLSESGYEFDVVEEVLALHHKHGRASVGTSSRSRQGFFKYYTKHTALYERAGMTRNLSEKYRGLAHWAVLSGDRDLARAALSRSVGLWMGNWKAWTRYLQFLVGGRVG